MPELEPANNAPERISNVARSPVYGEAIAAEEQRKAAPLLKEEEPSLPQVEETRRGPAPNIISVLPPRELAPAEYRPRSIGPEEQVAYAIMGLPGVSAFARSLARQLINLPPMEFDTSPEEMPLEGEVENGATQ